MMKDYLSTITEEFSEPVLIGAVIVSLLSFPVGLAVPVYLYIKANGQGSVEMSTLEVWTVVLGGILGIIAVEVLGRTGAIIFWAFTALSFVATAIGVLFLTGLVLL